MPFASPSVRKLARELGVPLNEINCMSGFRIFSKFNLCRASGLN
ncbi:E3 binding domain-containing protein [Pseudomonas sp. GL-RE-19]|nr:E3 binding domain-containing protein [Pseudomonas sp. GL-RE-19]